MKKTLLWIAAMLTTVAATAQTLNIQVGNVTYQFPASQTGDMTYTNGTYLTVMGKTFPLSSITSMTTDETAVTDNQVTVTYSTSGDATVAVAGNVAQYVTPSISGNHVTIAQSNTAAVDDDEITYVLTGTSTDGQFELSGSYKCTVSLAGVTLTNQSGAAINITNSKRIQLSAKKNTTNTLADCASGSQKACIYSKGQLQLQGNGTLNVVGNTKHAIKSASYIQIKNLTLNVTSTVGDALNCEEYLLMKSGTVTLSGIGDDGIQCDYGDETALTVETTDHEDEDTGNIYLEGGTIKATITAAAAKGIKAAGDMRMSSSDSSNPLVIDITTSGSYAYDSDDSEYKSASCLNTDGNMTINGGTITVKSTGYAGKGIKCDGVLTITDGTVSATASGSSSDTYGSAKAIKAGTKTQTSSAPQYAPGGGGGWPGGGGSSSGSYTYSGGLVVSGGSIYAKASSHEAIESKNTIDISGGNIYAESSDDAINSASTFTITGGNVMAYSTGNDGMDANGNFYIKGGNVFAISAGSPEVAIDANTEGGYKLYITGGNVIAIGGLESGSSLSGVSQSTASISTNTWYTFKNGSTSAFSFKSPKASSGSSGGFGPGGGMGGMGGGSSSTVIVATGTPSVSSGSISGTTIWNGYGIVN